jgi:hypothetical protein
MIRFFINVEHHKVRKRIATATAILVTVFASHSEEKTLSTKMFILLPFLYLRRTSGFTVTSLRELRKGFLIVCALSPHCTEGGEGQLKIPASLPWMCLQAVLFNRVNKRFRYGKSTVSSPDIVNLWFKFYVCCSIDCFSCKHSP